MPFDTLVANPARLSILTTLAAEPAGEFVAVRRRTGLTDGNLSAHARRLHEAGLIAIDKHFRHNRPVTTYHLTPAGRAALADHARHILDAVTRPHAAPATAAAATTPDEEPWLG